MRRSGLRKIIFAAVLSLACPAAAADLCATPEQAAALRTRAVQTDLMMAALSCDERERYNAFVARFRQPLGREGAAFRAYFKARYGGLATTEVNKYVTRLANLASLRYNRAPAAFCAETSNQLSELLALKAAELPAFIARQDIDPPPDVAVCTAQTAKP